MTKDEFRELFKEAGFKNKYELAKVLNLSYQSVNNWGSGDTQYPKYLKPFLKYYIKAKAYDELMQERQT